MVIGVTGVCCCYLNVLNVCNSLSIHCNLAAQRNYLENKQLSKGKAASSKYYNIIYHRLITG